MKVCSKCQVTKPDRDYERKPTKLGIVQADTRMCLRCRKHRSDWTARNPDKAKAYAKQAYQDRKAAGVAYDPEYHKAYGKANRQYLTDKARENRKNVDFQIAKVRENYDEIWGRNEYKIDGDTMRILFDDGGYAVIETTDYNGVKAFKWFPYDINKDGKHIYAVATVGKSKVFMHRLIMGLKYKDDKTVDHIDGDGLNNVQENLRVCTQAQNLQNTGMKSTNQSGFKGVSRHKATGSFQSTIRCEGKQFHLGLFDTAQEAAEAYDEAAIRLHKEYAKTNFQLGLL